MIESCAKPSSVFQWASMWCTRPSFPWSCSNVLKMVHIKRQWNLREVPLIFTKFSKKIGASFHHLCLSNRKSYEIIFSCDTSLRSLLVLKSSPFCNTLHQLCCFCCCILFLFCSHAACCVSHICLHHSQPSRIFVIRAECERVGTERSLFVCVYVVWGGGECPLWILNPYLLNIAFDLRDTPFI